MHESDLLQDLLKHLAESEYEGQPVAPGELAAHLALSPARMDDLLARARREEWIAADRFALTPAGREHALRVLRAHRLYETYLARQTGVPESAWHEQADLREHCMSAGDADALAARLGHPRFDPHGDPIPSAAGELPARLGAPLTGHPPGWTGRVVHIEDEPPDRYALIAAAGIAPDTFVRIERQDERESRLRIEGETVLLPRAAAEQITAAPLAPGEVFDDSIERLSALKPDEAAEVVSLSPLCRGLERNRLLDLGMVPGSRIAVDLVHPSGSPIVYRLRGAAIALRREQARRVRIRKGRP